MFILIKHKIYFIFLKILSFLLILLLIRKGNKKTENTNLNKICEDWEQRLLYPLLSPNRGSEWDTKRAHNGLQSRIKRERLTAL